MRTDLILQLGGNSMRALILLTLSIFSLSQAFANAAERKSIRQLRGELTKQFLVTGAACGPTWARIALGALVEALPVAGLGQVMVDRWTGNGERANDVMGEKALVILGGGLLCELATFAVGGASDWLSHGEISNTTKRILKEQCFYRTRLMKEELADKGSCGDEKRKYTRILNELTVANLIEGNIAGKDARSCHAPLKVLGVESDIEQRWTNEGSALVVPAR